MDRPQGIATQIDTAPYTTFKIGGPADYFFRATSEAELQSVLAWATDAAIPYVLLGGGSNLVFPDAGFRGVVIQLDVTDCESHSADGYVYVTAGAGMSWDTLVAHTVDHGWWGLENLSSIPGSVGASPIQNIGAYGVEVSELIDSVRVYDAAEKSFRDFSAADCQFAYRDSIFKHPKGSAYIVTAVTFRLRTAPTPRLAYPDVQNAFKDVAQPSLQEIRKAIIKIRAQKFPDLNDVGTAGSFFKNPIIHQVHSTELQETFPGLPQYPVGDQIKVSAAWLIEHIANARGVRTGAVGTHPAQALVFVNYGGATAAELSAFADQIAKTIKNKTGVTLEREVHFISETKM